jgi:hypothetical protein
LILIYATLPLCFAEFLKKGKGKGKPNLPTPGKPPAVKTPSYTALADATPTMASTYAKDLKKIGAKKAEAKKGASPKGDLGSKPGSPAKRQPSEPGPDPSSFFEPPPDASDFFKPPIPSTSGEIQVLFVFLKHCVVLGLCCLILLRGVRNVAARISFHIATWHVQTKHSLQLRA